MSLANQLATLETSGLIRLAQMEPEPEYLFRHALIQDAAYASILKADRRILHRSVADVLEQLHPEDLTDLAPHLAHHHAEAGNDRAALYYFELAGDHAMRQFAHWEAATYYTRALALVSAEEILTALYLKRGRALQSGGRFSEAWANAVEMETVAHTQGSLSLELSALIEQATLRVVYSPVFDAQHALALSERALALARALGHREAEAKIRWNQMRAIVQMGGDSRQAIAYGEQSLAIAHEISAQEQLAYTLNDLQYAYRAHGQWSRALEVLVETSALWQRLGNPHMLADNLNQAMSLHFYRGDFAQAQACADEAERVSVASANISQQTLGRFFRATLHLDLGRPDKALRCLAEAWELGQTFEFVVGPILGARAATYLEYGATLPALQLAQGLYTVVKSTPLMRLTGPAVMGLLARAHLRWGDLQTAASLLTEARAYLKPGDELRAFQNGEEVRVAEIELALAQHAGQHALDSANQFLTTIRNFGARRLLPEALLLKGRALLMLGQWDDADSVLSEAKFEAESLGMRNQLWPSLKALGHLAAQRGEAEAAQNWQAQARALIAAIADHCPTDPVWLPEAIAQAVPLPAPSLRAAFLHLAFDRDSIRAEYAVMRANFHRLLDSVSEADWHRRTPDTGWAVGELLVHLTLSLEQVPPAATALRRQRAYFRLPPAVFDWANLVYAKAFARLRSRQALAYSYDAAYANALALLDNLQDAEWHTGAICFGNHYWTVARLFANQPLHLAEHTAHIQRLYR